jgi:mRNA-degrading endonuclease YafQ of YafQ-DinJ toxin-antitoxin module
LSWTKAEGEDFKSYKVVASKTNENPKYPEDGYLINITNVNANSLTINPGDFDLEEETEYFFSITYLYEDDTRYANVVSATTGKIEYVTQSNITSSSRDGNKIYLNWEKVTKDNFKSYKLMYSFTDTTPVYEESGSHYYVNITDINTTSAVIDISKIISKNTNSSEKIYVSITTLYNGEPYKVAGNTKVHNVPDELLNDEEPVATTITNHQLNGNTVSLNWNKIDLDILQGYKVVYSFTDSTPVYDESGTHSKYFITNKAETSAEINLESIIHKNTAGSEKVYISITSVYDDFKTKKASNTIVVNIPEALLIDEEPVATEITSHELSGNTVSFNWNEIELISLEGYKVVYSFTDSTPVYDESGTHYKQWITNSAQTSSSINLEDIMHKNTTGSTKVYISITSIYNDFSVKKPSNTITINIPEALLSGEDEEPIASNITEHSISGNVISINWEQIDLNSFEGYKVVYSFTDPNPVYGGSYDGYYWITNQATTSKSVNLEDIIHENDSGSNTVYFSITTLYSSHSVKKQGNAVSFTVPEALLEEPEEPVAANLTSAVLAEDETKISLVWDKIELTQFKKYIVTYSFTNPNPVWGGEGSFDYHIITDRNTTSYLMTLQDLLDEKPEGSTEVYIAITAYYNDGTIKQGNAKTVVFPSGE